METMGQWSRNGSRSSFLLSFSSDKLLYHCENSVFNNCFTRRSHTFMERVYFLTGINRAQNLHVKVRSQLVARL